MSYTHLQVRSGYSLMNSTITIDKLVAKAKELNYSSLALTDEAVLYGVIPFYKACKTANIKPIIGMIVNVFDSNTEVKSQMILLAKNNTGYQSLIKLSTFIQRENLEHVDLKDLSAYTEGLIGILPADHDVLSTKLEAASFSEVKAYLEHFEALFGADYFYVGIETYNQTAILLKRYAEAFRVRVTVISDVHYLEEKDAVSYDCLQAMKHGHTWNMQQVRPEHKQKHLKSKEEIQETFHEFWPEAIHTSIKVAEECEVKLDFSTQLLPTFPLAEGKNANDYLKEQCETALPNKYAEVTEEIRTRLKYELETIQTMNFSDYFLIIADIISFARQEGIMVGPGRGSSAGSLVAYLLGITAVDPIKYQLLFERFLNPERQTMPDIDIDFSDERRDEVISYVRGKYGPEHVAQIITFGTFAARSIIRELIKTLEVSKEDARYVLRELPNQSGSTIIDLVQASPELKAYIKQSEKLRLLFSIAIRLEGIPRHISTHAAGVVISESPLTEHVPLTIGTGDTALTQYAMNDLEAIGLLKMDFLGLKNLSLLERVTKSIQAGANQHFSLDSIPAEDEKTFELLREGRSNGVFQLESQGMQRVLKELKPTSFEDIVAVNALYRPGPMEFIPNYINRKHGKEPVHYPHVDLQPILQKTHGVLVYQEQIMQIAKEIAGYSYGEADILRRAVSKKNQQVMEEEKETFIQGCMQKGYDEKVASEIFSWIVRFSNYGFPRSHAVAYSKISYQLSYLKAHYPAHFFAEILSSARNQQDKINLYIKEMKETGIELLPPSINHSFGKYTVENKRIRMGLHSIKGIGREPLREIITVRRTGKFRNLFDFCLRVSNQVVKRATIENLIMAGAFDQLESNRASLLASIDQAMEQGELFKEFNGNSSLFQDQLEFHANYVEIEDFTLMKKLQDEKELLGMYISSHPLQNYRKLLRKNGYVSLSDTAQVIGKKNVKTAAIIQEIKQIRTKRGEQMAFLTLADENATLDAVVFPDYYREVKRWLEEELLVFTNGKVEKRNDKLQQVIDFIQTFDEEELKKEPEQTLFIKSTKETNATALKSIAQIVNKHPGSTAIILYDEEKKQSYKLAADYYLHPSSEALQQLYRIFGKENVVLRKRI